MNFLLPSLLSLLACAPVAAQSRQESPFTPSNFSGPQKSHLCLKASLRCDSLQPRSAKGVAFTLTIRNDSTASITLQNVMDNFILHFYTRAQPGKELVPIPLPRNMQYRKGGKLPRWYAFEAPSVNDRPLLAIDVWEEHTMTIPAKGTLTLQGHIHQVWPPNEPRTPESPLVPLPAGHYTLSAFMRLTVGPKFERLNTGFPGLPIRYGP